VSIETRLRRLEAEETADGCCPQCGRTPGIVMVVIRPHAREGRVPEDGPPPGYRPWQEPAACGHCGRPDAVIRELYEDAQGNLWEPDRVQQPQED
jgi:hypothetical protein